MGVCKALILRKVEIKILADTIEPSVCMNMAVPHYFVELPMRELKTLEGNVIHVNVIIFKLQQKCGATHELYERIKYRYNIKYTPKTKTCNEFQQDEGYFFNNYCRQNRD